ncbi:hypothetical protein PHSC3_001509 [Chlamydiales bacterium STE3]|nr:hypothetical protein PHSC3_001509 [Chlamydiales bacterium STE3]
MSLPAHNNYLNANLFPGGNANYPTTPPQASNQKTKLVLAKQIATLTTNGCAMLALGALFAAIIFSTVSATVTFPAVALALSVTAGILAGTSCCSALAALSSFVAQKVLEIKLVFTL